MEKIGMDESRISELENGGEGKPSRYNCIIHLDCLNVYLYVYKCI